MGIRIAFIFIFTLFFINKGSSQFQSEQVASQPASSIYKGAIEYGLQHSANITRFYGEYPTHTFETWEDSYEHSRSRFTMDLGAFVNVYLTPKITILSEISFSFMGDNSLFTRTVYQDVGKFETKVYPTFALRYLKIPVSVNYLIRDGFFLQGGAYFATLLSASAYDSFWYGNAIDVDNINAIDAGLIAGFGMSTKIVMVGFRYSYGLTEVFSEDNSNLHNGVYQIVAQWKLYSDVRKRKKYEND